MTIWRVPCRFCLCEMKGFLSTSEKNKKNQRKKKMSQSYGLPKISKGCDLSNVLWGIDLIGSKKPAVKCWVLDDKQWCIIIMTGQQKNEILPFSVSSWANEQNTFFIMLNCAQDFAWFMAPRSQECLSILTIKSSWAQFKERYYDKNCWFYL